MRQLAQRSLTVLIVIQLIVYLYAISDGYCQEERSKFRFEHGLSLVGGVGDDDGLEFDYYAAYPRWGWLFSCATALEQRAFALPGDPGLQSIGRRAL